MRIFSGFEEYRSQLVFGLLVGLVSLAAVWLEFRYSYVETAIGRYLAWHNQDRRVFGQVWENVSTSENVQQRLDNLVEDVRRQEVVAERIRTVDRLVELVAANERVILSRDQFLEMYSDLPYYQSSLIIEPFHLLELIGKFPSWERTLIVLDTEGMFFYLVDGLNNVLESIVMPREYTDFFVQEKKTRNYPLDAVGTLAGGIYPAEAFFGALALLGPQEREGIPLTPVELISWRYRLQRVAVSPGAMIVDRMEMGFELVQEDGLKTYRILGRSGAVLALATGMDEIAGRREGPGLPGGGVPAPQAEP
ncbi:MAG: hypothetical protein JXQ83_06690 [Candidatus Glassbacteria bacterium]|nr:hypothetical protein [Candidatus Glassbacteria bacterium]